jgi:hypothetical protein
MISMRNLFINLQFIYILCGAVVTMMFVKENNFQTNKTKQNGK